MSFRIRGNPLQQWIGDNNTLADGWKVYTYQPGTTTEKATYKDSGRVASHTNPIILNARGEPPAPIWWDGVYKVVLTDENDVTIYTVDEYGLGEEAVLPGAYNLVKNGGFETDDDGDGEPDDWDIFEYPDGGSGAGTVDLDSTDQIEGANSLKFVSQGDGGGYATSDFFAVTEGSTLSIQFYLKSSVVDVRNNVDIIWFSSAQAQQSTSSVFDESAANPTSWTKQTATQIVPANARFAKIRIYGANSSDATPGTVRYDDIGVFVDSTARNNVFVNDSGGFPAVSTTTINLDTVVTADTWESIGPTGSGADNIWTALDSIPTDADWIEVKFRTEVVGTSVTMQLEGYAKKGGTSATIGDLTAVCLAYSRHNDATSNGVFTICVHKIPLDSNRIFDFRWTSIGSPTTSNIDAWIIGYGYNP